ncbi:hypothetical protein RDWZM_007442 [Blomia tropicalis]|uniref:Phosphomannomutase n=1 Tax=Blomia tropicalis TaxID=40697 RepID=A0A9Q0LZ61_BLOTA|nr:Phosphomannomutase 1 [Blomia tropicalis]KAJ6216285.1 hypothetical protein RDWZM_007442 [Blomia tropicalis]
MEHRKKTLVLFDVDGTLTQSRLPVTEEMEQLLVKLREKVHVGLVGGSDLKKISEQMVHGTDETYIERLANSYDYIFSENGLLSYGHGKLIEKRSIIDQLGEKNLQRLINFSLCYLSKLELPCKRGTFIEFRTGMINISPIGRSCSQAERLQFVEYDREHGIRKTMVEALNQEFGPQFGLTFAIGGQISIDCFPIGWDKTYCLRFVEDKFEKIYFVGDKTDPGGNDHEIYADSRTIGHSVKNYHETIKLIDDLFLTN